MTKGLRIGTRGSPLALAQARELCARLAHAHGASRSDFEIVVISTTGDAILDRALSEAGGKGLFTKELDQELIAGAIDTAVHSAKDLPTQLPDELCIPGYLTREDAHDVFLGRGGARLAELPSGSLVGTASLRRAAQVKRLRPDIATTLLRGNVATRLAKLDSGEVDGTLLALAGLRRIGLDSRPLEILPFESFLPAAGQGAIGLTCRVLDAAAKSLLAPILDAATGFAVAAERAFLAVLDGSCRTPIAAHAHFEDATLILRGEVLRVDGRETYAASTRGAVGDAGRIGHDAGRDILQRLPHRVAELV
jgi:hydroxymethylbilane synthase